MFYLFIFEGIGTSELILILIVALVLFGPRKLPQLSRKVGKSLGDFKRASEDFKQTWEREVERESALKEALIGEPMLPEDRSILGESRSRSEAVLQSGEDVGAPDYNQASTPNVEPLSDDESAVSTQPDDGSSHVAEVQRTRKRDWL